MSDRTSDPNAGEYTQLHERTHNVSEAESHPFPEPVPSARTIVRTAPIHAPGGLGLQNAQ